VNEKELKMKKKTVLIAAFFVLAVPLLSFAAMEHGDHHGKTAHEEITGGVKATFEVQTMQEAMKAMGMDMPKGVKETHHISVKFKDIKSGKALTEGEVKIKVQGPDKSAQTKDLLGMQGHFGADFEMAKKGKYGIMCKFLFKGGKQSQAKFWYTVK
jgi:hypothetical protein